MKVKNIMFFGAAAVILSAAGAVASPISNATDRQIVTSKAYVDSKVTAIETDLSGKQNNLGGEGQNGKVVTATNTPGTVTYTTLAGVATSGAYSDLTGTPTVDQSYNASSQNAQSGTAVAGAITSALEGVATDLSGKQDNLGGTGQGGKVVTATETAGEVTYTTLATVATSGDYDDLTDKPTIGDSNLTITDKDNNTIVFGANATSAVSGTLKTVPAKPNTCTDTNPCALITLDSGEYDWVQMAQPSNN